MALKLSIFTTITDPYLRGDNYKDAINCYNELADEVTIVDGGRQNQNTIDLNYLYCSWPQEFNWPFIGEQFTRGYEACSGDWVIHADLDYIFHEKDFGKIRQAIRDYPNSPGISFYKWQFTLPDRYNLKSRLVIAVNKGKFGDRIKFNGGGDLTIPTLDGKLLELSEMPQAGVPFYCYEKLIKTKEQIMDDCGRMERAWYRTHGYYQMGSDGTDESAYQRYMLLLKSRLDKPSEHISLDKHPRYIQETIKNLTPGQFGYNGFGLIERNNYVA